MSEVNSPRVGIWGLDGWFKKRKPAKNRLMMSTTEKSHPPQYLTN